MPDNQKHQLSRRRFLGSSALGIAGLTFIPSLTIAPHPTFPAPFQTPQKLKKLLEQSAYAHQEMEDNLSLCAETRWLQKKVEKYLTIFSGNHQKKVITSGRASLEESEEIKYEGKNCLCLVTNTQIENISPRPGCSLNISLDKIDISEYNRISAWVYPQATGYQNFYFHFSIGNPGRSQNHAPSLLPNQWNRVTWEISDIERNAVENLGISPYLGGCPPEALPLLKVFIGEIRAEKVEADDDYGWELKDRIAYCHSGYLPNMKKIAIAQHLRDKSFRLYDTSNQLIFEHPVREINTPQGIFYELDFSEVTQPGEYFLKVDDRQTPCFLIDSQALDESIWKSLNFLRSLRCGVEVTDVHSACHLNCKTLNTQTQDTVPNFGGWHDAGDLSQFEICTAEMAQAILELAQRVKNKDKALYNRLLEEGKVGISWLLRTRFGDGSRALAVSYGMWRDNLLHPDNESIKRSVAENGPFENFLASAACALAAGVYQESDPIFADWCLRVAQEDFHFAKEGYEKGIFSARWGTNVDSQVCGAAALAAAELCLLTQKEEYARHGAEYANTILACQKSETPKWNIPIRGFFYEDRAHTKTLTYEHRGHEQSPIHGLVRMVELFPNHPHCYKWKRGLELYAEYVLKTCELSSYYHLLPAHVYEVDKLNLERFTTGSANRERALSDLVDQVKAGIPLSDTAYLRILPAAARRGFHATLLSKAKAVSLIGRVLNNKELLQIAMNQIEWILGKNPFASSTMYGLGHNYHPLYVAFSRQMVGSLPVGIKTKGNADLPYWPVINNAVYKEIWGHTTGKFFFVLADLV